MEVDIQKAKQGDADALAYIQTENWKAAFDSEEVLYSKVL